MSDNLRFTLERSGSLAVVGVAGRIDSSTSALFEEQMETVFAEAPDAVVIDLEQLDYMSSAGLRVLLMAAKRTKAQGQRLLLCGLSPNIREVFDISGFSAIFEIADSRSEAQSRAQA